MWNYLIVVYLYLIFYYRIVYIPGDPAPRFEDRMAANFIIFIFFQVPKVRMGLLAFIGPGEVDLKERRLNVLTIKARWGLL